MAQISSKLITSWRFDSSSNGSPDAILLLDDGVFIDCNQAAVDMLYAPGKDELLSLSPSDLSPATQPHGASSTTKAQEMIATGARQPSLRVGG